MTRQILLLPGDGIGPEVVVQARRVLEKVDAQHKLGFIFSEALIGGAAIKEDGAAYPAGTQSRAREADAILLGAVGGPSGMVCPLQSALSGVCWRLDPTWISFVTCDPQYCSQSSRKRRACVPSWSPASIF